MSTLDCTVKYFASSGDYTILISVSIKPLDCVMLNFVYIRKERSVIVTYKNCADKYLKFFKEKLFKDGKRGKLLTKFAKNLINGDLKSDN